MARARVNPFDQGTAERTLFDHYRKASAIARQSEDAAARYAVHGQANRAKAEEYAKALRALGHGDKVTPLPALPDYHTKGGE
jgi:hypothetical protein